MADYAIPWWAISRLRFFDQEPIYDQDMIDEQAFHIGRRQRASRMLRTPGVADGLQVAVAGLVVRVAPGTAIDAGGNALVLAPANDPTNPYPPITKTLKPWTPSTSQPGWWEQDYSGAVQPNTTQLLYISFYESQEPGPGGAVGNTRWQQTPIIDLINSEQGTPPLAQSRALLLALVRVQDGQLSLAYASGALGRQAAGVALAGQLGAATPAGTIPPLTQYARPVPLGDGVTVTGALLEIGGGDGVALGLTDGAPDPLSGVVPLKTALTVDGDHNVAFAAALGTSAIRGPAASLFVGKTILAAHASSGGAADVSVGAPLRLDPVAGSTTVAVDPSGITVAAPTVSFGALAGPALSAPAPAPGVRFGSTLYATGQPILFSSADQQTARGFVGAFTGHGASVGLAGSGGVSLGPSASGVITPRLIVAGGALTLAGTVTVAAGAVTVPGALTVDGDLTVGDRVSSSWGLQQIITDSNQLDSNASLTVSFASKGGVLVFTFGGLLILQVPINSSSSSDLPPTTLQLALTLDGKPLGSVTGHEQFLAPDETNQNFWSTIMVPQSRFVFTGAPAQTHSLTVAVTPMPPLSTPLVKMPPTHLFASVLELPVAKLGGA